MRRPSVRRPAPAGDAARAAAAQRSLLRCGTSPGGDASRRPFGPGSSGLRARLAVAVAVRRLGRSAGSSRLDPRRGTSLGGATFRGRPGLHRPSAARSTRCRALSSSRTCRSSSARAGRRRRRTASLDRDHRLAAASARRGVVDDLARARIVAPVRDPARRSPTSCTARPPARRRPIRASAEPADAGRRDVPFEAEPLRQLRENAPSPPRVVHRLCQ